MEADRDQHDQTAFPEILTEQEAIRFLRIDLDGTKHPAATLKRYRDLGLLRAAKISRSLRYTKKELLDFVDRLAERRGGRRHG